MNKWGMHVPNEGFRNLEAFFTLGVDNFTGLEISLDRTYEESADKHTIGRELRNRCPDARILVRFYGWSEGGHIVLSNWSIVDPIAWARQCAEWANSHRWLTDRFTLANEMNLPAEGGGWTKEWYQRINDWLVASISEFRRLCPWAIIHWPALASGHSEDQDDNGDGTIGYEICAPSIRLCDVVDHHDYWRTPEQLFEPELADWYAFRFKRAREVLLGLGIEKPIFISECGWYGQHETEPEAGQHLIHFFKQLYDDPSVIGATPFIWDSDDAHVGQRIGRCDATWWPIQSAEKQEVGEPEPIPPPEGIIDITAQLPKHATVRYQERPLEAIRYLVIHHTATPPSTTPEATATYHISPRDSAPNGWPGIGYHFWVAEDGQVFQVNHVTTQSYHCKGHNREALGICLPGSFHGDRPGPSEGQLHALEHLVETLQHALLIPDSGITGHYELTPTLCPGARWFEAWRNTFLGTGDGELDALRRENAQLRQLVGRGQAEIVNLHTVMDEAIRVLESMS